MRQLTKYFLWIGCLALVVQQAEAFSLLGPVGNGGDAWQVTTIGYNPLPGTDTAFFLTDSNAVGPKNLGEGYRRNTPVMYYAFGPSFSDFFGSNGEFAVQQAFDLLNGVFNGQTNVPVFLYRPDHGVLGDTNGASPIVLSQADSVDAYTTNLSEFPLNTEGINYQAQALGLQDVKSYTLATLVEEMGLADAVRYTWGLHTRTHVGNIPCPVNELYTVDQRNFDIVPSSLSQVQYSPYVNDELYNYFIYENCGAANISPPDAAARPIPADPLIFNPPVSSGQGLDWLPVGRYYTGLTRDDAAGLRFLYSTNNWDTPSEAYRESPAAGSVLFSTNLVGQYMYTSNLTALLSVSSTNDPATLQGLYPGLQFTLLTNYPGLVTTATNVTYATNYPIGYPGGLIVATTNYATTPVIYYKYAYDNIITNFRPNFATTTYQIETITYGPVVGQPAGQFYWQTNYQSYQSNILTGPYLVLTNGACAPDILQTVQTNVDVVTNLIASGTNAVDGSSFVQNLIYHATNYVLWVHPCTLLTTNPPADYQGIGRIQFIRVRDDNYDYQSGTFITPITNQYTMVIITNGQYQTRTFQRVVTTPDFIVQAFDEASGPADLPGEANGVGRGENFNQANVQTNLAGPGTIDPPTLLVFSKTGTLYENQGPSFLNGPFPADQFFLWGSFDGTTNAPVVYPNGTSLANLANAMLIQLSPRPPNLPSGTNGVSYSVPLTVETGATPPYTWSLTPNSAGLPPGLVLTNSPTGEIVGTPTQSGTFDGIAIQMTDSSTPSRTVQAIYSITINNP